jgi:conjugal transfer/entry exclusion protein
MKLTIILIAVLAVHCAAATSIDSQNLFDSSNNDESVLQMGVRQVQENIDGLKKRLGCSIQRVVL